MKKLSGFLISLLILCSCSKGKHIVTYRVYWPNNVRTYTVTINDKPYLGSDRGTNYLKVGNITGPTIIETNAPIEIINIKKLEYE